MKDVDIVGLLARFRVWWEAEMRELFIQAKKAGIETEWAQDISAASDYWQDLILLAFDNLHKPIEPYAKSLDAARGLIEMRNSQRDKRINEDVFQDTFMEYLEILAALVRSWRL